MKRHVVDAMEQVVQSMKKDSSGPPYFMAGHPIEINNRQDQRAKDGILKSQRYPLIALKQPFRERFNGNGLKELKLNMVILAQTTQDRNADERRKMVFHPVLYPLLDQFFYALKKSGLFTWKNMSEPPVCEKIDWPHWGTTTPQGNEKNYFTDPLDAIELIDLQLTQRIC